ncbi:ChaN family lipoprotein [Magnetococcus sp. PR-3]|uniref:ChaN family lipoprotein n=1 Tax=Magnetococcus sp. PR-3 TaxID=3120355 RepID=UPI002FCE53A9
MPAPLVVGGAFLLAILVGKNMPVSVNTDEIVDLKKREAISQAALTDALSQFRVVLVGEQHDDPYQHNVQLQVIRALHQKHGQVAVGMEQFPRHLQPVLDRWSQGELTEDQLLDQTQWYFTWGMDPELYLPILRYVRDHKLPLLAINVKRSTIAQIREKGLENINEVTRQSLPKPAEAPEAYRTELTTIFESHIHSMMVKGSTDQFIEAQTTWDAVMADGLLKWAEKNPNGIAIGIAGTGHIEFGYGIAHQLKSRGLDQVASVIPWTSGHDWIEQQAGDYAWGTQPMERGKVPPPVRLGIVLEDESQTANGPVEVRKVMPDSIAEKAGFKIKDRITALDGHATETNHHLVRLLRQHNWGDALTLTIEREGKEQPLPIQLPKEAPKPKRHP